jgi:hypothetical protein
VCSLSSFASSPGFGGGGGGGDICVPSLGSELDQSGSGGLVGVVIVVVVVIAFWMFFTIISLNNLF